MTEQPDIEFVDRYTGRPRPPWNYCRGHCEAMGSVPVRIPELQHGDAVVVEDSSELLALARGQHADMGEHECDGWHFVTCPDCHGTGVISRWRALRYLPEKAWRTLRFVWDHGIHQDSRPPWWTRRHQLWVVLRIAVGRYQP